MIEDAPTIDNDAPPVPLDTMASNVEHLDAMLVCHVADGHVYAKWIRHGVGIDPKRVTSKLGETYRVGYQAAQSLRQPAAPSVARPRSDSPFLTLELDGRVVILVGVRAFVAVFAFDGQVPLGLARLSAKKLTGMVAHELPFGAIVRNESEPPGTGDRATLVSPVVATDFEDPDREVQTVAFDRDQVRERLGDAKEGDDGHGRERLPTLREVDRAERLLAYLEEHAPEPHIVKLRVALRAGLSLAALEHPQSLGTDAIVLIETAAEDILGVDRAELRGVV